ncbi:S8 family serine peptidase [Streptomyces sp. NPDC005408]|uniref:S8 family serine peptidase n=1 Tax=Streptomyces sp. NPDC005408 TaxID=3155341 RepID=UPI00339DC39B
MTINGYPLELARDAETVVRLDRTRVLLGFREPQTLESLAPRLRQLDLEPEPDGPSETGSPSEVVNHTTDRFWVRSSLGEFTGDVYDAIESEFNEQLAWIGPVYHDPKVPGRAGLHCPLPNVVLIEANVDPAALSDDVELREDTDKSRYLTGYRYCTIAEPRRHSAHAVRTRLLERESYGHESVLFESMVLLLPYSWEPADTFFNADPSIGYGGQWNLVRTRVGGPGRTAWDLSIDAGTIAIVDSGCDLTHPDLRYVAGTGGSSGNGADTSISSFASGHGTMVAGVAAATTHNLKGTAGVAGYGARVMPLAFTGVTDTEAATLINFAVDNGARVINMSFNVPGWSTSTLVNAALTRAYNNNVIVCGSSGNGSGAVTYPATNARVIACGSTDQNDLKVPTSNYGNSLSVVAPGVGIPTTTVQGTGNLSDLDRRDWTSLFQGTSAAVPHVSGLAALLLFMDSTMTSDEVRNIIEGTADRVGPAVYNTATANGPWRAGVGHGRINALDALSAVLPARLRR